jgi:hypothetical protein
VRRSVGVQAGTEHKTIELTGRDRPGLSEDFAILADLKCSVALALGGLVVVVFVHSNKYRSLAVTDTQTTMADHSDDLDQLLDSKLSLSLHLSPSLSLSLSKLILFNIFRRFR